MPQFKRVGIALLLISVGCLMATTARAGLDAKGRQEVDALLAFVGHSHCIFIRNGRSYGATEARAHLQNKLNYLLERDQISSAEQFIERVGSKSSFSGKPYRVNCGGNERLSADWLADELWHLRLEQP